MIPSKGRPPSTNPKKTTIQVRVTDEQRDYLEAEADRLGYANLADYLRDKILPKRLR